MEGIGWGVGDRRVGVGLGIGESGVKDERGKGKVRDATNAHIYRI
jgi:hypothetical protein